MNRTALSLERSKAAPLQLQLEMDMVGQNPEFRDLITPYNQNVENLWVEGLVTIGDPTEIPLANFPLSTPNLRSLKLLIKNDTAPGFDPSIDPFESFPGTLRSLELYDIPLYHSFLKLRTLTELPLHYYTAHTLLDTILDLLEGNRSLGSVDLKIACEESPPRSHSVESRF